MKKNVILISLLLTANSFSSTLLPGKSVLIESPNADLSTGKSQFFSQTSNASNIKSVFLDIGSLSNASSQTSSGTCPTPGANPTNTTFTFYAPQLKAYKGLPNVPCLSISQLIAGYTDKNIFIWVSNYNNTPITGNPTTYAQTIATALNSQPQINGIAFEYNDGDFNKSFNKTSFFLTLANLMPNKLIFLYGKMAQFAVKGENTSTLAQAKNHNIVAAISLYGTSAGTLSYNTPNALNKQFQPLPVDEYQNQIQAHVTNGTNGTGIEGLKFIYVIPGSGTNTIWNSLNMLNNTNAPALSPKQIQQHYSLVTGVKNSQSISSPDKVCQFAATALNEILSKTKTSSNYSGIALYSVKPNIGPFNFWQAQAMKQSCSNSNRVAQCFAPQPTSVEPSVINALSEFSNGATATCSN